MRSPRLILSVAVGLIVVHLLFRAWLLFPSYFWSDDFNLLREADRTAPDLGYLFSTYNGHLMPLGRLIAWFTAQAGPVNWPVAASSIFVLQVLGTFSALWMLVVLFGVRWAILAPLTLFLSSALTVPSLVWWAVALNFSGLQLAFFLAVGSWVTYLRGRRARWLLLTVLAVTFGLLVWVKALLLVLVLAYIALAYFEPHAVRSPGRAIKAYGAATLVLAAVCVPYVAYYLNAKPAQVAEPAADWSVVSLVEDMWATTFATGALGGPWDWAFLTPPAALVDPPTWTSAAVWSTITAVVLLIALRRRNTGRAWALLIGYLAALAALVTASRPSPGIGLEPRYVADGVLVLVLVLGLVTMEIDGAPGSSRPRRPAVLVNPVGAPWVVALVVAIAAGGALSSARYATSWHQDSSREYVTRVQEQVRERGAVDLAPQTVPNNVMSRLGAPHNNTGFLLPLIADNVFFPGASDQLMMLDSSGTLQRTAIDLGVVSQPGPLEGCGWKVTSAGRQVPLTADVFDNVWWARIGYLGSTDSPVTVTAGDTRVETSIRAGLNDLYVRLEGEFDEIAIRDLDPGTTVCVDVIEVGQPEPGGPL